MQTCVLCPVECSVNVECEGSGWAAALGEIVQYYISLSEYFYSVLTSEIAQGNIISTTGTSAIAAKQIQNVLCKN